MQDMYHKYFEDFKLDETCRSSGRQMTEADTRISIGVIEAATPCTLTQSTVRHVRM